MRYRVRYGVHPESLRSGRTVGPGDELSDEEASENLQLVERGVLFAIDGAQVQPTIDASPAAHKMAQEAGIDLAEIAGTGTGGRVIDEDVKKAIAAAEASNENPDGDDAGHQAPGGQKGGAQ